MLRYLGRPRFDATIRRGGLTVSSLSALRMIDWKQRFLQREWGIGYIVILSTALTAYLEIKPSYIDATL